MSVAKLIDIFSEQEGSEIATSITESNELDPSKDCQFTMAATSFGYLEGIRLGRMMPYLGLFDPNGLKSTVIGKQTFWTIPLNCADSSSQLPS